MSHQKNKNGFSLIEVVIASAILIIVILGITQFLTSTMKSQKNVQNNVDFDIIKTSLNMILNSKACDGSFGGISSTHAQLIMSGGVTAATISPIQKITQGTTTILDMSTPDLGGGLTLTKLNIRDAVYDGTQKAASLTYNVYIALLEVEVKKNDALPGLKTMSKNFSVRILVNPSGNYIERCGATRDLVPRMKIITASGSWTVPPDVTTVKVRLVGGGGGGARNGGAAGFEADGVTPKPASSVTSGGGGGAGGYCEGIFSVTPGSNISVTIGAGGAGASSPGSKAGSPGAATSFGTFCSATGGQGGAYDPSPAGGGPGVGSGGEINLWGGYGTDGVGKSQAFGNGGASYFGGGGRAGTFSGMLAVAPGSGGGAGYSTDTATGSNGAPGIVILEY